MDAGKTQNWKGSCTTWLARQLSLPLGKSRLWIRSSRCNNFLGWLYVQQPEHGKLFSVHGALRRWPDRPPYGELSTLWPLPARSSFIRLPELASAQLIVASTVATQCLSCAASHGIGRTVSCIASLCSKPRINRRRAVEGLSYVLGPGAVLTSLASWNLTHEHFHCLAATIHTRGWTPELTGVGSVGRTVDRADL